MHWVVQKKMRGAVACGLTILLLDMVLSLALWAELVLLKCTSCGGLAGVWAFGAVKWALLHCFTSMLTDGKPPVVLHRLSALLCLLLPVLESGRVLLDASGRYAVPHPDPSTTLLGLMSSSLACVVWEVGLSINRRTRRDGGNVNAGPLLMRMVKYFRPDVLYLIAAFSFLILGVICECEPLTLRLACKC